MMTGYYYYDCDAVAVVGGDKSCWNSSCYLFAVGLVAVVVDDCGDYYYCDDDGVGVNAVRLDSYYYSVIDDDCDYGEYDCNETIGDDGSVVVVDAVPNS
jgi:hypothetical protein